MRRSKSNPAKYAKNYRSISQRRMIGNDDDDDDDHDDESEMKRLRALLSNNDQDNDKSTDREAAVIDSSKETAAAGGEGILSLEMLAEYGGDEGTPILLSSSSKKNSSRQKKKKAASVELTPQEVKQAAQQRKKAARRLKQLEQRQQQKQKRHGLYRQLAAHALTRQQQQLLTPTASHSKAVSKRQALQRALQRERAGLALTPEEQALLYPTKSRKKRNKMDDEEEDDDDEIPNEKQQQQKTSSRAKRPKRDNATETETTNMLNSSLSKQQQATTATMTTENANVSQPTRVGENDASSSDTEPEDNNSDNQNKKVDELPIKKSAVAAPSSAAAQLMASLSVLKSKSTAEAAAKEKAEQEKELERQQQEDRNKSKQRAKRYVPAEPIEIKTTQSYEPVLAASQPEKQQRNSKTTVRQIQRPPEVTAARYDLPVAGMEFEIMDAIRNHDVTILCAETGSGKSTQVPQFLYEAGVTTANDDDDGNEIFMVGVTQPRRVAAVSTAKRVCYEMGHGNGRNISKNNLVAYQTRFETSGFHPQTTHIKFMTDGILLQEIQSDLLLRRYACIVLDEAHERNLNTDVLVGLIRAALQLRRLPSSDLPPLRVVVMSATLRVQDFTGVFDSAPPAVVQVPGRTHPVTIHHSRVTELDEYEDAVFRKTCKIHRQLPQGSILVFLTGKQEIIRMVNRLRRSLNNNKHDRSSANRLHDQSVTDAEEVDGGKSSSAIRDMDDDEVDAEIFQDLDEGVDYFDDAEQDEPMRNAPAPNEEKDDDDDDDDNPIPQKAIVLPLYSLMSTEEQTKVFAPVPEGHRLIVVATNIAETSITIPGVSYVVDSGRHKCRNYNAETGVASFDIMWISKAAADQRAGRAGRTGPGHCYRLYSSSLYARHMDAFALPEVLTRPLEDVVLAMKAMRISNVAGFPFPTPPDKSQLEAAVKLLSNIGCVDTSRVEERGGDGDITRLGAAVAKLPLGVRYGKMLLVAAQAGVLDYAVVMVAALSEASPFVYGGHTKLFDEADAGAEDKSAEADDEVDADAGKKKKRGRWMHSGGDVLAAMLAVGAYTYAGRSAGGASEKLACRKFCEENGLNHVIMERIQKMRSHLTRLCRTRLRSAEGIAAKTGGFVSSMLPPNKREESLLCQSIASGLLDNVAMLAPLGSIAGEHPYSLRSAYLCCSSKTKEPLFMDRNSAVYSRDARKLPQWICFDSLMRKTLKDGTSVAVMKNITPVDPSWLGPLAKDSRLLVTAEPLSTPSPAYDRVRDAVMCSVRTKFGSLGWEIPPLKVEMFDALNARGAKKSAIFSPDDSFRWFARFLFEGNVIPELKDLKEMLTDSPSLITRQAPAAKVTLLVSALSSAGVDSLSGLRKHWAEVDNKFLFSVMKKWIKPDRASEFKTLWIATVKENTRIWNDEKELS